MKNKITRKIEEEEEEEMSFWILNVPSLQHKRTKRRRAKNKYIKKMINICKICTRRTAASPERSTRNNLKERLLENDENFSSRRGMKTCGLCSETTVTNLPYSQTGGGRQETPDDLVNFLNSTTTGAVSTRTPLHSPCPSTDGYGIREQWTQWTSRGSASMVS